MAGGMVSGPLSRDITVETTDRNSPRATLTGTMTVLVPVKITPPMANFPLIPRSSGPQTKTLTLTRGDAGPINPTVKKPEAPNIATTIREIEPGQKYELDVTVNPPWPNGMFNSRVMVDTGLAEQTPEMIAVSGKAEPRLAADPAALKIPQKVESDLTLAAKLVWSENKPAKVLEATVNDPKCRATVEEQDGQQVVVLHVPAGYEPTRPVGTVVAVKTDDPAAPSLQISVVMPPRPPIAAPGLGKPTTRTAAQPLVPSPGQALPPRQPTTRNVVRPTPPPAGQPTSRPAARPTPPAQPSQQ